MRRSGEHRHFHEQILTITIFAIVMILSYLYQGRISHNSGKGWDGVEYYSIAEQFSHGHLPQASAPFVYRIGTPFLASLIPTGNLLDAFWLVNALANAAAVFLLYVFLRMHLADWRIRTILLAMFMLQWHGPVRFAFYYPAYTDPFSFVFLLAGLILIAKFKDDPTIARSVVLGIVIFIGVLFREVTLLVALIVPFIENPIDAGIFQWKGLRVKIGSLRASAFLPLLLGLCGIVLTHMIATKTNSYSFARTAYEWAYEKPLPTYVLSWFIAFGPILAIVLYDIKACWTFLMREQWLFVLLLGSAVLAWIGGSDTERILYWSMPVVYVLIGKALQGTPTSVLSLPFIVALAGLQAISQRIFWPIPDFPNQYAHKLPILTPIGKEFPSLDLYAYHGDRFIESVSLLQYALCAACILLWLHNRSLNLKDRSDKATA
jgi:hypothetical protein